MRAERRAARMAAFAVTVAATVAAIVLGGSPAHAQATEAAQQPATLSSPVLLVAAALLFVGLSFLLWLVLSGATGTQAAAQKRLDAYFGKSGNRKSGEATPSIKDSAVAMTNRVVSANLETKVATRLGGAGSTMTPSEWVLLHAGIAVGAAMVGFLMGGAWLAFLGLLVGAAVPWLWLRRKHRKRLGAFNGQLAETLDLISGGLQAGLSLPQAVDTVVQQGSEPMVGELRRALIEQRLGVDITDALESVGERMESGDFNWVVIAIRIQREVGGNLAEILRTVSETLREREYLRRQVRSLSAEGRISGYILTGLPVLVFIYMTFVNRPYVSVLWTTLIGWLMLGGAVMLLTIGGLAMKKLATVEV